MFHYQSLLPLGLSPNVASCRKSSWRRKPSHAVVTRRNLPQHAFGRQEHKNSRFLRPDPTFWIP
jgi:hypothetical protein